MSPNNLLSRWGASAFALASVTLLLPVSAHASAHLTAAQRHKLALAAKAKAAAAAKAKAKAKAQASASDGAITPLPPTGAGASVADAGNAPAPGGTALNAVLLYSGNELGAGTLQASAWGGGTVADHDGDSYTTAGHTIQIDTAGLYQGGQIQFMTPVELGDLKSESTRYLQIIFSAAASTKYPKASGYRAGPGYGYGAGGGTGQSALPQDNAEPQPGRVFDAHSILPAGSYQIAQGYPPEGGQYGRRPFGRGGNPYAAGANPYGRPGTPYGRQGAQGTGIPLDDTAALPNVPIGSLHVIYEYSNGARSETLRPITLTLGEDVNWLRAGIPLSAIPAPPSGDAQLAKLYIGTDSPATLNIGEIRLVSDTTAITADAGRTKTVPVNSQVNFVGTGEGGASTLKYEWNFDSPNASTFVPEAEGVKATYYFSSPGDHVVTLRVSDLDGIKSPATATVTIHVVDQSVMPNTNGPGGFPGGGYPGAGYPGGGYPGGRPSYPGGGIPPPAGMR